MFSFSMNVFSTEMGLLSVGRISGPGGVGSAMGGSLCPTT